MRSGLSARRGLALGGLAFGLLLASLWAMGGLAMLERAAVETGRTVQEAMAGPEVNLDQAAELPTRVKLYPQDKWAWGWNNSSEIWNGRLAMVGFSAFLLELISGRGPLHAIGLL